MQHGVARRAIKLGRKLDELPVVAGAAHTPERAAAFEEVEAELVEVARLASPGKLRDTLKGMTDALDGDGGASADADEYAKNRLTFDATFNGRFEPHGSVDAESGEIIATAFDAEIEALKQKNETRSRPELRAEAWTSICR